jgi:undecaprenyl-diphosphatase
MNLWETLLNWDVSLFYLINHVKFSPFLIEFAEQYSTFDITWAVPVSIISIYAIWRRGRRALLVIILMGLAVGLSDLLNSHVIKDIFGRIRPCHVLPNVVIHDTCGSSFSFPSSHCANFSAAATVLSIRHPKALFFSLPMVLAMAFFRVYEGVHYPSDCVGGIFVGVFFGLFCHYTAEMVESWRAERKGVSRSKN